MITLTEKLKHLWNRAGFGMSLQDLRAAKSLNETLAILFQLPVPEPIAVVDEAEWHQANRKALRASGMAPEAMKAQIKSFRQKGNELGLLWMQEMMTTDYPLREKMALFWHGHFATRAGNPYFDQLLLHEFRSRGMGKFGELLTAVSKSPGMLKFLNNQQNKKGHPNENFAREVMELFTLGRGNYTEQDVKEAARAFTGWAFDEDGAFAERERQHDNGLKTFLVQTGNFTGDDILRIILAQRQTALFITRKIYRYFVNEDNPDEARIAKLAVRFFEHGYDIGVLMRDIFSAEWFYDNANLGAKIKSPVELLAGMERTIPVSFAKDKTLTMLQRVLGQQLFYPPNVAGWPGGRAWIDASSLVIRMRLAEVFYTNAEMKLHAKEIDAEQGDAHKMPMMAAQKKDAAFSVGKTEADWTAYVAHWQSPDPAELPDLLAKYLIAIPVSKEKMQTVISFSNNSSKEHFIQSLTIRLMSLPEFQLA